jgi:hypothetical protein
LEPAGVDPGGATACFRRAGDEHQEFWVRASAVRRKPRRKGGRLIDCFIVGVVIFWGFIVCLRGFDLASGGY